MKHPHEMDSSIGEDGLTNQEREFLRTPVVEVDPSQRHLLVSLRDKKANYIWACNDRERTEDKRLATEKETREIEADKKRHADKKVAAHG